MTGDTSAPPTCRRRWGGGRRGMQMASSVAYTLHGSTLPQLPVDFAAGPSAASGPNTLTPPTPWKTN